MSAARRPISVVIEVEGVGATTNSVDGYQPAADWLLDELGRASDTPYPPVPDAAALTELVANICDKLGTSGVQVRWGYED